MGVPLGGTGRTEKSCSPSHTLPVRIFSSVSLLTFFLITLITSVFPYLLGSAPERDGKDPHVVRSVEMVCAVYIIGGMGGMWFHTVVSVAADKVVCLEGLPCSGAVLKTV